MTHPPIGIDLRAAYSTISVVGKKGALPIDDNDKSIIP
jgi:hypothetical protein